MEEVLRRENLLAALKRVQANKGAPGIDGMTVDELPDHLRTTWPAIREQLLSASYVPSPVREMQIPKPGGGTRMLGIPTVLDRLITQAISQVMSPIFDPAFSAQSYGFRPDEAPTKRFSKCAPTSPTDTVGLSTLTWKSSLTESIMTC